MLLLLRSSGDTNYREQNTVLPLKTASILSVQSQLLIVPWWKECITRIISNCTDLFPSSTISYKVSNISQMEKKYSKIIL